ncbi:MAG: hypothetical protein CMK07_08830 [Ponticaulis sp.]|nr:hypothetical protein [Ponticaulis sp.]
MQVMSKSFPKFTALLSLVAAFGAAPVLADIEPGSTSTYTCRTETSEIIVSETAGEISAFVLSSCSRVGCMTLGLDDSEDGKLRLSANYLDGSTIDIATTARMTETGILINSPIVIGQFGSELTNLVGFANQFIEFYHSDRRDELNCQPKTN